VKKKAKSSSKRLANKSATKATRGLQLSKVQDAAPLELEDVTPIIEFLEMFQQISDPRAQLPLKLISIKIPMPMLEAFKFRCQEMGVPYQTMIKRLMKEWLGRHST
jgi:predicted DNA binding CopG/RHH family protein